MKYLSVAETAEKWGICQRRIQTLLNEKRIESATRIGRTWAIPDDAQKPADARIKSGKYIKTSENPKESQEK
ncbi:helix-turn-helix domain-containing protein [Gardnerella pickettii]|uniref:helix-turn-helix domain-containing protein n=1 Tax=Gardnerella pickettii TaxID=2914924 RepID=UPI000E67AD96|nr:helix-turn-helix domain-containing protein [Bifidobacterium sp. UMB9259]RIY22150.1 DNA-binding protein [Bifidobacteriaceae bacterium VN002]